MKKRLKDLIFEQKLVPWRIQRWFCHWRNLIFNINTGKYWDAVWTKEIASLSENREMVNLYKKIIEHIGEGVKLIDLGCGLGIFMNMAKEARHCNVFGIDISNEAIRHIKEKGMEGISKKIPPIPFASHYFDVVVSTELLEHVSNPIYLVKEMLRIVKKNGVCFFSVPDNCMYPHQVREHVCSFTKGNLYSLLKKINPSIQICSLSIEEANKTKRILFVCKNN